MIWVIGIIGGMILVPIISYQIEGYWCFLEVLMGAILGAIVAMVATVMFTCALDGAPTTTYEHEVTQLIALNDGMTNSMHGTFFLGTGTASSDSNLEYRFIYRTDKGMTVGERTAKLVYLEYIEEDEVPRLVKWKTRYDDPFWNWFLGAVSSWETFYIPEGSITNTIEINLE